MNFFDDITRNASQIEAKLDYHFQDRNLLYLAFVHRSFVNENREVVTHNERLEFLGDSVLGMIMAEYLYRYLPETPEGDLSYLRSRLVEASSCVIYMQKLDVGDYIMLGKGEQRNGGRGRESIMSDLFEAIIGAIFLDGGIDAARRFLFKNFSKEIDEILKMPIRNWKAILQDYCQKKYQQTPHYKVINELGPDHGKIFRVTVNIQDSELGVGEGSSKKIAQQAAAQNALDRLKLEEKQM